MDWLPICSWLQLQLIHLCVVICFAITCELLHVVDRACISLGCLFELIRPLVYALQCSHAVGCHVTENISADLYSDLGAYSPYVVDVIFARPASGLPEIQVF